MLNTRARRLSAALGDARNLPTKDTWRVTECGASWPPGSLKAVWGGARGSTTIHILQVTKQRAERVQRRASIQASLGEVTGPPFEYPPLPFWKKRRNCALGRPGHELGRGERDRQKTSVFHWLRR